MWIIQFLILTASVYTGRSEDIYPRNLAIIVGERICFTCGIPSHEESIIWKVKKIGQVTEELISNGSYVTKANSFINVSVSQSTTGNSVLRKDRAELEDGGTYKCIRTGPKESVIGIGTAQLIVFGSKPECSASADVMQDGDFLQVCCRVRYNGSLNPVIKCSSTDGSNSTVLTHFTGPSNVTVYNKFISSSDNGRNVSCTTYFEPLAFIDNRTNQQKATNAPEFGHTWINRMNVQFPPKYVDINPRKDTYMIGDVIRCNADGNPRPQYAWKESVSNDVTLLSSTLTVNDIKMHNRTYECTAKNTKGSQSTSITIRVSENISTIIGSTMMYNGVTIVAGVLCAILLVVVITITIRRVTDSCRSSTDGEFGTGPDIVRNAEEFGPMQPEQPFDGYARAEDLGIELQVTRYAGNGNGPETRREVSAQNCTMVVLQGAIPIYDEINSEEKAASAEKCGREFPVYGKVNKSSKEEIVAANNTSEEFPAYGKVQKKDTDKLQDFVESSSTLSPVSYPEEFEESKEPKLFEENAPSRGVIVGADGTEYLDMRSVLRLMQPENQAETSAQSTMFTKSQYAEIDHLHKS